MDSVILKINSLKGAALDWAVAKTEGRLDSWIQSAQPKRLGTSILDVGIDSRTGTLVCWQDVLDQYVPYRPSLIWGQGGPIMETAMIGVRVHDLSSLEKQWVALNATFPSSKAVYGPTPLVAAMRFFVSAGNEGSTISVPKEMACELH